MGRTIIGPCTESCGPDHPHAGGENCYLSVWFVVTAGPSPRGWGEPERRTSHNCAPRTIPTRVGRTMRVRPPGNNRTDHPHAGGENPARGRCSSIYHGPSPRGWGEQRIRHARPWAERTIPTRVGRTHGAEYLGFSVQDHPHAGGENHSLSRLSPSLSRTIPTRVGRTRPHRAG